MYDSAKNASNLISNDSIIIMAISDHIIRNFVYLANMQEYYNNVYSLQNFAGIKRLETF